MKEHLQIAWLTFLQFQIILPCSMNKLGALDANTDIYALLSLKSTASDLHATLLVWNLNSSPILGTVSLAPIKELKNGTSIHLTVLSWLGSLNLVQILGISGIISPQTLQLQLILWPILLDGQPSFVQHINLAQNSINGTILVGPSNFNLL